MTTIDISTLPALIGSEKQVAWAAEIRERAVANFNEFGALAIAAVRKAALVELADLDSGDADDAEDIAAATALIAACDNGAAILARDISDTNAGAWINARKAMAVPVGDIFRDGGAYCGRVPPVMVGAYKAALSMA